MSAASKSSESVPVAFVAFEMFSNPGAGGGDRISMGGGLGDGGGGGLGDGGGGAGGGGATISQVMKASLESLSVPGKPAAIKLATKPGLLTCCTI